MTNVAVMPIYGTNLKNLPLQNQMADDLETVCSIGCLSTTWAHLSPKTDDGWTTDAYLSYKLTNEPSTQVS